MLRRSQRFRRVRSLWYRSRYLSGWKDQRPRQRDLLPQRNGENGPCYPETLRNTHRHPDGPHSGSGRLDQSCRVKNRIEKRQSHQRGCHFLYLFMTFFSHSGRRYIPDQNRSVPHCLQRSPSPGFHRDSGKMHLLHKHNRSS